MRFQQKTGHISKRVRPDERCGQGYYYRNH